MKTTWHDNLSQLNLRKAPSESLAVQAYPVFGDWLPVHVLAVLTSVMVSSDSSETHSPVVTCVTVYSAFELVFVGIHLRS